MQHIKNKLVTDSIFVVEREKAGVRFECMCFVRLDNNGTLLVLEKHNVGSLFPSTRNELYSVPVFIRTRIKPVGFCLTM